jgi:phosphoribosylformylglycinamidine synthase
MVQTNTVQGPGSEAGVMRIKGTGTPGHERGLAMALDGNGRWAYLNPKLGAMHAVAEAARKVAMTGAKPVAATNCLNFGNPEKPEIMAQLSDAIDGISEACTALGTPITGGNVSLYNETRGEGIYPTPVLGIVGILDDVTKSVPSAFQCEGDAIVLLWPIPTGPESDPNLKVPFIPGQEEGQISAVPGVMGDEAVAVTDDPSEAEGFSTAELTSFGSSEYAKVVLGGIWGQPPPLDIEAEADLHTLLGILAKQELLHSASDISDGGIAVAIAQAAFPHSIGASVAQDPSLLTHPLFGFFAEPSSTMLLTADPGKFDEIEELASQYSFYASRIGTTGGHRLDISVYGDLLISAKLASLKSLWANALEATLHDEVTA